MIKTVIGVIAAVISLTAQASAEMVKYTDAQGSAHYVDSIDKVPPEYRAKMSAPTLAGSVTEHRDAVIPGRSESTDRLQEREQYAKTREVFTNRLSAYTNRCRAIEASSYRTYDKCMSETFDGTGLYRNGTLIDIPWKSR